MQGMQQTWSNPMGMGSMPDPSSSMTMMGWLRGMQCMQQMMQAPNPDQLLSNLQIFRPGQSQQASQATANAQQQLHLQAHATSSSSASGQIAACTAGVQQPSQPAVQSPNRQTAAVPQDPQNSPPAGGVAPGMQVQTELDDEGILANATIVSDALDEKKGETNRASASFKNGGAKGKGKGAKKKRRARARARRARTVKRPSARRAMARGPTATAPRCSRSPPWLRQRQWRTQRPAHESTMPTCR